MGSTICSAFPTHHPTYHSTVAMTLLVSNPSLYAIRMRPPNCPFSFTSPATTTSSAAAYNTSNHVQKYQPRKRSAHRLLSRTLIRGQVSHRVSGLSQRICGTEPRRERATSASTRTATSVFQESTTFAVITGENTRVRLSLLVAILGAGGVSEGSRGKTSGMITNERYMGLARFRWFEAYEFPFDRV